MQWSEFRDAVNEAKRTMNLADKACGELVEILPGRLRRLTDYYQIEALKKIKRELRDFNIQTGRWKE